MKSNKNVIAKKSTLRSNALWNVSGSAAYAAAQWGMMIVLAKLAGAGEVGQFALGLAITAPLFMLTNLQLRALQITDVENEIAFGEYLGLRLATVSISLVIIASYSIINDSNSAWIVFAIGLSKAFESISDVAHGLFQRNHRSELIAKSLIVKAIFSVLTLGISYHISRNLLYSTLVMAASWLFVLMFFDLNAASRFSLLKPKFDLKRLRKVSYRAFPLGVSMMFVSLQTNVIRYFLEHHASIEMLGVFSALSYVLMIGSLFMNSICQAASPHLAGYWSQNNLINYKKLFSILLSIAFLGSVGSVSIAHFFGAKILAFVYSEEFVSSKKVFVVLMFGGLFSNLASVVGYALTAAKIIKPQPYLFFAVFLVATIAAWSFVPNWGLLGAAWATVVIFAAQLLGSVALIAYAIRTKK